MHRRVSVEPFAAVSGGVRSAYNDKRGIFKMDQNEPKGQNFLVHFESVLLLCIPYYQHVRDCFWLIVAPVSK